jgi:hypothetical protein
MPDAVSAIVFGVLMLSQTDPPSYIVHRVDSLPRVDDPWDAPAWAKAETAAIERFHPRGSDHRPRTQVRLLHDGESIAIMFHVEDRYVVAKHTAYQSPTHLDSCVEFFVRPAGAPGYFNFEFNAIGTLLLWYVEKPRGRDGQFQKYSEVSPELAKRIAVHASLTGPIETELEQPVTWTVSYRVPKSLFEAYTGIPDSLGGYTWSGNFYKCADASSHPHWGYWADVGDKLDFHQPAQFGVIRFE